jgi:hypothetical protein
VVFLPVLKKVEIRSYGLYPGADEDHVTIDLAYPVVLAIGANGLGKSTLIEMLLRCLTGTFDIPSGGSDSLGRTNLRPRDIGRMARRYFASRVSDGAVNGEVELEFDVGRHHFFVTRRLRDLELVSLQVDGSSASPPNLGRNEHEFTYQRSIVAAAEVGNFSDWLLLLRYVTFFQDDRRPLLWDGFAQSQVLRPLYLSTAASNQWQADEREILELDSDRRNLSAVLSRREESLKQLSAQAAAAPATAQRLEEVTGRLGDLRQQLPEAQDEAQRASADQSDASLQLAEAELASESAQRAYEHAKLQSLARLLPSESDTARYIVSLLFSDETCLACGNEAPVTRVELEERLLANRCVICSHELEGSRAEVTDIGPERLDAARAGISTTTDQLENARAKFTEARTEASEARRNLLLLQAEIDQLQVEEAQLVAALPKSDLSIREALERLRAMRTELDVADSKLAELRSTFQTFVATQTAQIFEGATRLENAFSSYANDFLLEQSQLSWSPRLDAVGQSGQRIPFPQFSVSMTGTDFVGERSRLSATSVSESQRHYIDLAFRMSLVQTATSDGFGSIVIDSPEASLDAVFEPRAADQLLRFASGEGRTLVMTSNVTSGDFLPKILAARSAQEPLAELVDLLTIARPTAAVRERRVDYRRALDDVVRRAEAMRNHG